MTKAINSLRSRIFLEAYCTIYNKSQCFISMQHNSRSRYGDGTEGPGDGGPEPNTSIASLVVVTELK